MSRNFLKSKNIDIEIEFVKGKHYKNGQDIICYPDISTNHKKIFVTKEWAAYSNAERLIIDNHSEDETLNIVRHFHRPILRCVPAFVFTFYSWYAHKP